MLEFKAELIKMNDFFKNNKNIKKDKFKMPFWVGGDPLAQIYKDLPQLYQSGEVVYAYLVQANNNLFKSFPPFNSPADIIFSLDGFYKSEPLELQKIAYELFSYKDEGGAPPEIKQITDSITDEMERSFNIPLPLDFTKNRQIYFTTIVVHRNHLPKKRIVSSVFPIVCDVERSGSTVILPKNYWTKDFISFYKNGLN